MVPYLLYESQVHGEVGDMDSEMTNRVALLCVAGESVTIIMKR